MKKIVITMALAALVGTSYGQGFVSVAGNQVSQTNTTLITSGWTGGTLGSGVFGSLGNLATGQAYREALLTTTAGSPTLTLFGDATLASDWLYTGQLGQNNTFAGRLSIGSGLLANNAPIGNSQSWLLVAWSTSLGPDWATVETKMAAGNFNNVLGWIGWSGIGVGAAAAASPVLPLVIQGTGGTGIIPAGFSLLQTQVPEPSTIALAGLGGLSLLLFRRRK
jgi:hypothetical protein